MSARVAAPLRALALVAALAALALAFAPPTARPSWA